MAGVLDMSEVIAISLQGNDKYNADCYADARSLYEKALDKGEFRMQIGMRIDVRNALARCYHYLGDYQEAAVINEGTLKLCESAKASDINIEDIADIRYELARNLSAAFEENSMDKEKMERAVALHEQNLQVLKGSSDTGLARKTRQSLGRALARLGRYAEAEKLYRKLLREGTNSRNSDLGKIEIIELRHNYASVLYHLGKFEESKTIFLKNQTKIEALSDTQKTDLDALSRIAGQYLDACIEATSDLSLAISRSSRIATEPNTDSSERELTNVTPPDRISAPRSDEKFEADQTSASQIHRNLFAPRSIQRSAASSPGRNTNLRVAQPPESSIRKAKSDEPLDISKRGDSIPDTIAAGSRAASRPRVSGSGSHHEGNLDSSAESNIADKGKAISKTSRLSHRDRVRDSQHTPKDFDRGDIFGAPSASSDADKWFNMVRYHADHLLVAEKAKTKGCKPVHVAIIDSGSDFAPGREHSGWLERLSRDNLSGYEDFTGVDAEPASARHKQISHGAYCAALLVQVAPRVKFLIANIRSADKDPIDPGKVANAIAWAIESEVDIITMSFGWDFLKPEVDAQLDRARLMNILTFAAASNNGDFAEDHGAYPACHPTVFCIYSCRGSGYRSAFNPQRSLEKISFMFPGEEISILGQGGRPVKDLDRLTGTSYATPLAVGTAALIIELVRCQREDYRQVEWPLKRYEGMAAVFQRMARVHTDGSYHVRPWSLLCKAKVNVLTAPSESSQWAALKSVLGCLERFQAAVPDLERSRELYDGSLKSRVSGRKALKLPASTKK